MPPHPLLPPPGQAEKPNFAGLTYGFFKIGIIFLVFAVISATVLQTMRSPANSPVPLWLQNIYYATNIAVALVAILALVYAKKQAEISLRQAEIAANASKAEVYRALFQDLISPIFQQGSDQAKHLYLLHQARSAAGLTTEPLGAFCAQQIAAMETTDFRRFHALTDLFTFLENLGLQARRGYLSLDDVAYLLKGTLVDFGLIMLDYLEAEYRLRPGVWNNAIWLLKTIPDYQPESPLID